MPARAFGLSPGSAFCLMKNAVNRRHVSSRNTTHSIAASLAVRSGSLASFSEMRCRRLVIPVTSGRFLRENAWILGPFSGMVVNKDESRRAPAPLSSFLVFAHGSSARYWGDVP